MTSNQPLSGEPGITSSNSAAGVPTVNRRGALRAATIICMLAGIWLFVSPWVYGAPLHGNAWNSWAMGAAMVLFSWIRLARPVFSTALSWANVILAVWTFFSPWIYGYTGNTGRFINSLCVGVIVFVCALIAARLASRPLAPSIH